VSPQAQESSVLIDTTASEKNITYPTDAKLAIKIINRLNKLAKHHGIQQRSLLAMVLRRVKAFLALARFLTWRK
jgi:IS5 family transposase